MTNMETMNLVPFTRSVAVVVCGLWLAAASPALAQVQHSSGPEPRQEARSETRPSTPAAQPAAQAPASRAADVLGFRRFRLDPGFAVGVPVGAFGDNTGASFGGALDFGVGLGRTPVSVGAAIDYLRYGTETRHIALFPALPEVVSDVDTTNNVFRAHALVRVQPRTGRVRPYAEGLLGFSYAYTSTSADLGNDAGASTTHLGDYAPSAGFGGGVTVVLVAGRDAGLSLGLGLRYLTGGDVSYLTRGAIQRDEHGATFEPERSPLSMLRAQIGIAVDF
ncbi:MAG: hypothetical protein J4F37_11425 [Acidobacteria bacterium]|nr:hypothetical protein [Acidobacteriota bacterium]